MNKQELLAILVAECDTWADAMAYPVVRPDLNFWAFFNGDAQYIRIGGEVDGVISEQEWRVAKGENDKPAMPKPRANEQESEPSELKRAWSKVTWKSLFAFLFFFSVALMALIGIWTTCRDLPIVSALFVASMAGMGLCELIDEKDK